MSIKNKTISGLKWSFADSFVIQLIQFFIGLVLARLLSPTEYGIIGMSMVFIAISETFVHSGLGSALIRKQNCSEADYNTMFYTNIGLGVVTFSILFFAAGAISRFYSNPELFLLVRIMAINLIINSFGLVETAILTKRIDFKRQTKISLISSLSSGAIGIGLAFMGFGYWSLAIKTLCQNTFRVALLHLYSDWKPKLMYSIDSFKDLFGFGVKLLGAGLINTVYKNIYKLVIGKYFSAAELGYYSRAEQFKNLASTNLEMTTQRVTYPVLASMVGDDARLKAGYKKLIKLSFYITSTLMLLMIVNAREIILILIGNQWAPAIPYLKIICISGALYPLHALNLNMLNAKGRSDLFLKLEIIKKILVIPVIIMGIHYGMIIMLWGMVLNSFIAYLLNSMFSAKLVGYSVIEQLLDITPTFIHTLIMAALAFGVGTIASSNLFLSLVLKTGVALLYLFLTGYIFKIPEFQEIKTIAIEQIEYHYALLKLKKSKNESKTDDNNL